MSFSGENRQLTVSCILLYSGDESGAYENTSPHEEQITEEIDHEHNSAESAHKIIRPNIIEVTYDTEANIIEVKFETKANIEEAPDNPGANIDVVPDNPGANIDEAPDNPGANIDEAPDNSGANIDVVPDNPGANIDEAPDNPGANIDVVPDNPGANIDEAPDNRGANIVAVRVLEYNIQERDDIYSEFNSERLKAFLLRYSSNCDGYEFDQLQELNLGDDCLGSVQTFTIDGLKLLKTIKIGKNSFTQVKKCNWDDDWDQAKKTANNQSKSFHILNCESLESIQIGEYSFSDFAGEFELKNLPQLQSIRIGTVWNESRNFWHSSFVIRGMERILNIIMIRSSKSTIHYFG